jgi:hypothetical protein
MAVELHPHAMLRLPERGAAESEVIAAIETGESFPAKHGRTCFRRNFRGPHLWRNKSFDTKQLEVYAVFEEERWLAITVIVKFF